MGINLAYLSLVLKGYMRQSLAIPFSEVFRTEAAVVEAQVRNRDRSRPHYGRKFYHAVMGLFCFVLYAFVLTRTQALWILTLVGVPFIGLDIIRLRNPALKELSLRIFGSVMRDDELKKLSANSFYLIGLTLVTAVFPKPVTLLAVLFLGLGDPIAAIVGTRWGKHKIWTSGVLAKKSLEGALANAVLSVVTTFIFARTYMNLPADKAIWFAVMGGVASTLAEILPLPIDDNFTIPVVSASLLYFLALPIL